jgi:hypothetical protein
VEKYRMEGDATLSRRIARLNMHSIGKKSARYNIKAFLSWIALSEDGENFGRLFIVVTPK